VCTPVLSADLVKVQGSISTQVSPYPHATHLALPQRHPGIQRTGIGSRILDEKQASKPQASVKIAMASQNFPHTTIAQSTEHKTTTFFEIARGVSRGATGLISRRVHYAYMTNSAVFNLARHLRKGTLNIYEMRARGVVSTLDPLFDNSVNF